jgi:hypothetical protein
MESFTLAEIIRLCVEGQDQRNDAWRELLRRQRPVIHNVVCQFWGNLRRAEEFEEWFPAWLRPRLPNFLMRLCGLWPQPTAESIEEREQYARNWLGFIAFQSACPDFVQEQALQRQLASTPDLDQFAHDEGLAVSEAEAEQVRGAAAQIQNQLHRVAFWLRYYRICGALLPPDEAWLTGLAPHAAQIIRERYEAAHAARDTDLFTGTEIAELMGRAHLTNGGQDWASQMICRGLAEVRSILGVQRTESHGS